MKHVVKFTPEFILCCYILLFISFKQPGENWDRSINSDGKGYYAYLPAFFIYHDFNYKFVESYERQYYPANRSVFKEFRTKVNGNIINKCFPGLALLWLPFFLLAHLLSYICGFPADGYSLLYQYAISIAAIFYLWLGCRILMKLLGNIGASAGLAAFITLVIAFGTNIVYFTLVEDSMSHVYSFFVITAFLFTAQRYFLTRKGIFFLQAAVLFALVLLIRPTNGLVILLLPLVGFGGQRSEDRECLPAGQAGRIEDGEWKKESKYIITGIALMLLLFSLPFIYWHYKTGQWIVYQYGDERFHFLHPHFFGILFSYNRGWFVYTPVAFVSLFGFAGLYRQSKIRFYGSLSFLLLFIYIASCWWMWYYASKCGQRIFVDIYAFTAILLFYLLNNIRKLKFIFVPVASVLVLLTGLNLLQSYQHSRFVFPATEITRDIYWDSFFRTHKISRTYLPADAIVAERSFFTDMEKPVGWENLYSIRMPFGTSGTHSSFITRKHPYSIGLFRELAPLYTSGNRIIRVSALVYSVGITASTLVAEFNSGEQSLSYNAFYLAEFVLPDHWTPVETSFYVPRGIPENSVARIYFFNNKGSAPLFIDDMTIDFISLKEGPEYRQLEGIILPVR